MRDNRLLSALTLLLLLGVLAMALPASAQTSVLTNNSGDGNTSWFIEGEPTLIINGFDLSSKGLTPPITINAITINVEQPVSGASIDAVVYSDPDGGSPINASLVSRQSVDISGTGAVRVQLPQAVQVDAPVVWLGFYLPVDFRFFADTSGTSVLTYWGWTPGGTFDLANLGSAQVFGPSDGSAPVNINLGGVARITAEISVGDAPTTPQPDGTTPPVGAVPEVPVNAQNPPIGVQMIGQSQAALNVMQRYPYCGEFLFYDNEDIRITGENRFELHCRADIGRFSPGEIRNFDEAPDAIPSFERKGVLYDIFGTGNFLRGSSSEELVIPVTHCIRPSQFDLNSAVIGIAYGAPRVWTLLPSVRYGELVCAEVTHQGFISYFVPRTGDEPTLNANLYFSGTPRFLDGNNNRVDQVFCRFAYTLQVSVYNEGFETTPPSTLTVRDFNVRTGTLTLSREVGLDPIPPGETVTFRLENFQAPATFVNELHRMVFNIDPANRIAEANENDNETSFEYVLNPSSQCE